MKLDASNVRRIASGTCLAAALLLLILGLTLLSKKLTGIPFAIYWLTCFFFTGLAGITALIDMALLRRKLRQEQRELIATTLADSEAEKARKLSHDR